MRLSSRTTPTSRTQNEHDVNPRKYWFLVLGVGLFTKKCVIQRIDGRRYTNSARTDADGHCDPDDVLIYFTKEQAERRWATYCHRRHTHDDDDKVVLESDDSDDEAAHSLRSVSVPPVRSGAVQRGSAPVNTPMPRAASVKSAAATPRATSAKPSAKPSTPTKCREVILPLFMDDSPPSISTKPPVAVKRESVSVKQQVKQKPLLTILPDTTSPRKRSSQRARARTSVASSPSASPVPSPWTSPEPPSAISTSVSSVSSISTASSNVAPSIGVATAARPAPLQHLGGACSAGGSGSGAPSRAVAESPSTRLLYNSSTRTLYKDMKKAVREMAIEETMQVVDCEDVVGYCAGKTGKMGE
ncbi:hypothetical protein C8R44DRAFT_740366 [Mycena epipterygia]|nr:hypothetical protein C8R44DRAFT_740366 [Mycena epipterygia]